MSADLSGFHRKAPAWGMATLLVAWAAACGEGGGGPLVPLVPDRPETPNRAPEAVGSIPPVGLAAGDDVAFDVSSFFSDPDGDALWPSSPSRSQSPTALRGRSATSPTTPSM